MIQNIDFTKAISLIENKFPYILVDKILEINHEKGIIKALKCTSNSEPYYVGHFPENPIMPGVLLISAFLQVASIVYNDENLVLDSIEKVRFQHPVYPGNRLILIIQEVGSSIKQKVLQCTGEIGNKVCIKARLCLSAKN